MRGDSPLTVGERELIAAYTSILNSCSYCAGVHVSVAKAFNVSEEQLASIIDENENTLNDKKLAGLLRYVRKVTVASEKTLPADVEDLLTLGWTEDAVFSALSVCTLFNKINRIVNATGCVNDNSLHDIAPRKVETYASMAS